jgi:DNA-binding Lrp family transcriptional regulator
MKPDIHEANMQDTPLDAIDRRILDHLQGHARATTIELAAAVKLSPAQCSRRHRRLEELGLITRYETRLDAPRLGLHVVAFVHVVMERGHMRELGRFKALVGDLAQIQECYAVTGDSDYVVKVVARDLKSLSEFLMDTLMRSPGVQAVRSTVCLDEIKCTSALPLG